MPDNTQSPTLIIQPSKGWMAINFQELWEYRELLYFLTWRDIKVRYKQTVLGAAWAIIQPFFTMVVFSIFFGKLARMPSDGLPYPIFAYCALLPWGYFAGALGGASNSLIGSANLLTKVYFPRLIIPLASTIRGLVDFAVAFTILIGMMLYYGIVPTTATLTLPLFLMMAMATALGVGLWLSALSVRYRDVQYLIPFLTQLWLFATPVAYPSSLVPEAWRPLYGLNPMVGVIEGFRWALLGKGQTDSLMLVISVIVVLALLVSGMFYFRRTERTFADVV
ncbi:MAG: ABC transporter permease [Candidatus Tectomicrobia bacterium]|nr:ABC transporter permease [Candidatus Tectomicrobia bacterium]